MWHCAASILNKFKTEVVTHENCTPMLNVDHTYVITVKNSENYRFQKNQLASLCTNTTFLLDYDMNEVTREIRSCLYEHKHFSINSTKYHSQIIKLLYGVHDSRRRAHRQALFLEDDALVRIEHLHLLNDAIRHLHDNFTIIHVSSYNPMGTDGISMGLHQKSRRHMRFRPTLMMPGVANVISYSGIKHIHRRLLPLPYDSATDLTLSDIRQKTAPQHRAYTLKPFAFTSGRFGIHNIFRCASCQCERSFRKRFNFRNETRCFLA